MTGAARSRSRGWWRRRATVAALSVVAVTLVLAYGAALVAPAAGLFHDDGIYVVTARALAEGRGYRIISLPDAPPQTKYPILFPWLLSLVWQVAPPFPASLPWLRLVPLLSTLAWLWTSWRLIRLLGGSREIATGIVLLTAAAPWTLFLSTTLLSETLFAALLTGALWALAASDVSLQRTTRLAAVAATLSGAACLTRAAGVAVVAALLAWLMSRRRWRQAAVFAAVVGAIAGPWALWVAFQNASVEEAYYSASPYLSWNIVFGYTRLEKLDVLVRNVFYMALTPAVLWGAHFGSLALFGGAFLAIPLVVTGIWRARNSVVAWCVASVIGLSMLWVWPPTRFIAPIVPLLLWLGLDALHGKARLLVIGMGVVVGAAGALGTLRVAATATERGSVWPSASTAEDWRKISPLLEWVKHATSPGAVITGNLDPAYYLFTNRVAVRAFEPDSYALYYAPLGHARPPLGTLEDFRRRLLRARVDYCIWTPARGFGEGPHFRRLLDELATEFPGSLRVVAGEEASGYVVYAVDRSRLVPLAP